MYFVTVLEAESLKSECQLDLVLVRALSSWPLACRHSHCVLTWSLSSWDPEFETLLNINYLLKAIAKHNHTWLRAPTQLGPHRCVQPVGL